MSKIKNVTFLLCFFFQAEKKKRKRHLVAQKYQSLLVSSYTLKVVVFKSAISFTIQCCQSQLAFKNIFVVLYPQFCIIQIFFELSYNYRVTLYDFRIKFWPAPAYLQIRFLQKISEKLVSLMEYFSINFGSVFFSFL